MPAVVHSDHRTEVCPHARTRIRRLQNSHTASVFTLRLAKTFAPHGQPIAGGWPSRRWR
jgi:hypothetical protein